MSIITASSREMTQVLQNLIGNALKYRRPGEPPRIHITGEKGASVWVISVQDNVLGFRKEDAERIFEAFRRLHGRDIEGTGIRFSICKRIVPADAPETVPKLHPA